MAKEHEKGFLSRWSRKKLDEAEEKIPSTDDVQSPLPVAESRLNPETPEKNSSTEATTPLGQQEDIDPELKKKALKALFRQPEFDQLDGLNEYDDDFTQFTSLGDVVTHEMKRMLKLAEKTPRADVVDESAEASPSNTEQNITDDKHPDQEDDELA